MMFNFWVNQHLFYGARERRRAAARAGAASRRGSCPPGAQWAHFLRNHDELDLGRLSDEQRARDVRRVRARAADAALRPRHPAAAGADARRDRARLELAYSLLFSLPGTPVLRYGDEIGMGEDLALRERDAVRTPMQWSDERNAGFSTRRPARAAGRARGPYGYEHVNVEEQRRDPSRCCTGRRG